MTETQISIKTDGKYETFDILEPPDTGSELVKSECSKFKNNIDFQRLVSDFTQLGDLIRLAENGAVDRPKIQIQIRDIGRIITELVGDTSLAIFSFGLSSTKVVDTLATAYEYLLDSYEDQTLIKLASIEQTAKKMLDTAAKLKGDIKKAQREVCKVSNAEKKQKGTDDENQKKNSINEKELTKKQEKIKQLEGKINTTDEKIKAEEHGGLWYFFIPRKSRAKDEKEKEQLIEEQRHQKDALCKVNEEIAALASKICQCKDESVLSESVIESLIHAITSLNNIEGIMEKAQQFWKEMHEYCLTFSTVEARKNIENAINKYHDEDERKEQYHSKPFKREVVKEYARWVAMRETCSLYKDQIDNSYNYLVKYLKESPNREQSRDIVNELANKLKKRNRTIQDEEKLKT